MNKKQLQTILDDHKLWLADSTKGQRAVLSNANLDSVYLNYANLSGANLYGANLYGASLIGANLYGANLSNANLWSANLYEANLSNANLYGTNLEGANLYGANLIGSNLYGANLRGANLTLTDVFAFALGAHFGFAHFCNQYENGSYVRIGCEGHSLEHWLENYKEIGKRNKYTNKKIRDYGDFLKYLTKRKA